MAVNSPSIENAAKARNGGAVLYPLTFDLFAQSIARGFTALDVGMYLQELIVGFERRLLLADECQNFCGRIESPEMIGIERQRTAQIPERGLIILQPVFDVGAMAPGLGVVRRKVNRSVEKRQGLFAFVA